MYKPYEHQVKPIDTCISILTSSKPRKEIVVAPTGTGKSLYIAFTAMAVDFPIVVLQPSSELLEQNYEKYIKLGGKAEIYSQSLKTKKLGKVTFATIGSIKKEVEALKKLGVKSIIVDEVHLASKAGSQLRKFIKDVGIQNVLGLTATPLYLESTMNGAELKMMTKVRGSIFKDIAYVTQISELVEKKYWTPLRYKVVKQDGSVLMSNSSGADYTLDSLKKFYNANGIESQIVKHVDDFRRENKKSILVFVSNITEAEQLQRKIPGSRVVHSGIKPNERKEIVDGFKNGTIQVVININILSVGFDHPGLDAIITARPTMSIAIYYQQIGRGVRLKEGKKFCDIVDLSGNYEKFGKVEELRFQYIDGFGWGLFNSRELLSNYPMIAKHRPTVESLIASVELKRKKIFEARSNPSSPSTVIWFGAKHKGKSLEQIAKEDMSYLTWMYDKFDFNSDKLKALKLELKTILKL